MKTDIAIVGAGFAGTCAAHVLAREAFQVTLVDRQALCPDVFRAEKLEPDQARILRELGLLERRAPVAAPIGVTLNLTSEGLARFDTEEQYGISYADTVNRLRREVPQRVRRVTERVEAVVPDADRPTVRLADGSELQARLVVLATGGSDSLITSLGLRRRREPRLRSLSFGFDISLLDCPIDEFRGFNYFLEPNPATIDYVTIFVIGSRVRVNLFTQLLPMDGRVGCFKQRPESCMRATFPRLEEHIGPFRVTSKVQVVPTSYSRLIRAALPGVVVVGEEYQSVSPTTGTGLSRVLTDVKVLCSRHAARWLSMERVTPRDVNAYYRDAEKVEVDRRALSSWIYYQNRQMRRVPIALRLKQKVLLHSIAT